jgi:ubiquinone biosynthesis protein COQ9
MNGVILKIDFEKAYDKFKWSFLQRILIMKSFSDDWRALIHKNNSDEVYLSKRSIISNAIYIVADMLAIIIECEKYDGQIERMVPHLVDGGLSIL